MAYGFKLGQIEGLDSSVKKVNLTITGTTIASYVLNYGTEGEDEGWTDNMENPNFSLAYHLEEYILIAFNMDEPDVGDEYTINLSLPEAPTQAFKEAVGMATEPIIFYGLPSEFVSLIESTLASYIPTVIAADGKFIRLPQTVWRYADAVDKDAYEKVASNIADIATRANINAYTENGILITIKRVTDSYKEIGAIDYDYVVSTNHFILVFKYELYHDGSFISYTPFAALTEYVN